MIYLMKNPFEYGRILDSRELVNRREELRSVDSVIESGGKMFLIGPRRFGKTSLLRVAAEKRRKRGDIVLEYNAEGFPDIEHLVRLLIQDSADKLTGPFEKTGEKIKRYFKSLRPEISFSVTQTEWKATLGANVVSEAHGSINLFVEALNGLEKLASEIGGGKKVALIIDEFQEILAQDKDLAEKQIRSAIQEHRHTAYIFAGSKTRMLNEMITDPSRPFYRLGKPLFVETIPRKEFKRFLISKFSAGGFIAQDTGAAEKQELAGLILDLAKEVPYNVQMLAHEIWNRLLETKSESPKNAVLTKTLIEKTLDTVVRQNDPIHTQVWNGLTANQKKALAAAVTENGSNLRSSAVTTRTKMSASTMQRALESLTKQDIHREEGKGGNLTFRFEDPFFAHWISLFTFVE